MNTARFLTGVWLSLVGITGILMANVTGCASEQTLGHHAAATKPDQYEGKIGVHQAAAFAADGKLWRVSADKQHVYVNHSEDYGKSFSSPVIVNPEAQRIKISNENRPNIAVDKHNRIIVSYPAEGQQPASLFFSLSDNQGNTFSQPREISDKANEAISLQSTLATSPNGTAYLFWHDDRDKTDYRQLGNNAYYSTILENGTLSTNSKVAVDLCECCRLAVSFFTTGEPVLFGRFIYDGHSRDHGMAVLQTGNWQTSRVTHDEWRIEACPEHGPALAISSTNDVHIAWFTQGPTQSGLFYAHSRDRGATFSAPMAFGNALKLSKFPTISTTGSDVSLTWLEFDGHETQMLSMHSGNSGNTWDTPRPLARTASANDKPIAIQDKQDRPWIYWSTRNEGLQLFPAQ